MVGTYIFSVDLGAEHLQGKKDKRTQSIYVAINTMMNALKIGIRE